MGIEDALCLSTFMKQVKATAQQSQFLQGQAIAIAFEIFNAIRRTRSQWLVNGSRRLCNFYYQPEWGGLNKVDKS